jgi:hypothetical protein
MKRIAVMISIACFLSIILAGQAVPQDDTYLLRMGTQKCVAVYDDYMQTTLNLHASNLPLPGSEVDIRNLQFSQVNQQIFTTKSYDPETNTIEIVLKQVPVTMRFGYDFFQLPPLEKFFKEFLTAMGENADEIKEGMFEANETTLHMTPQGEILGFDVELPEGSEMQAQMVLGMIENYIIQIMEPSLPENPIRVGEGWTQNINLDKIPFAGFSPVKVDYKLENVSVNEKGEKIAKVTFDCRWHQDVDALNQQVMGQKIPYYEDKEFEVSRFNLFINLKVDGSYEFNITDGYTVGGKSTMEFVIGANADLKKLQGHKKDEIWKPSFEYAVYASDETKLVSMTGM